VRPDVVAVHGGREREGAVATILNLLHRLHTGIEPAIPQARKQRGERDIFRKGSEGLFLLLDPRDAVERERERDGIRFCKPSLET
jgi:hypothetical protein